MKAVTVHCIPERRRNHRLQDFLRDFVRMNTKFAKIELDVNEYASPDVARSCMAIAAVRGKHPVRVSIRGNEIYLVRTDM